MFIILLDFFSRLSKNQLIGFDDCRHYSELNRYKQKLPDTALKINASYYPRRMAKTTL